MPTDLELGELPTSYGKHRLVLLPVDPYLIYSYWQLAGDPPPTTGSRAILRLHESASFEHLDVSRPFDVEVDLAAGNWYVHLWSPGKAYRAELGLRGEDGSFSVLARSNPVSTPPAWPVPAAGDPRIEEPEPVRLDTEAPAGDTPEAAPPDQTNPIEPALADAGEPETSLKPELDSISDFSPAWPEEPAPADYVDAESLDSDPQPPPFELQELEDVDLTQYSESRFTAGITSHGGPLGS